MPRVRELLNRFRPAGASGAASGAGVPVDRHAGVEAEVGAAAAEQVDEVLRTAQRRRPEFVAAVVAAVRAELAGLGETDPTDGLARRRDESATAVLRYVEALARRASVPLETVRLDGEPAARVLEQSRAWPADLIVLGRSDRPGPGEPYVGAGTRRVLEFADRPVLVVPGGDRRVEGS